MFGRETHTPKPEILFEPRPLRTTSIAQVYVPTFIRELGTQKPYHETYAHWINPANTITTKDLETLYQQREGEGFRYYEPEEYIGQVWYIGYYSNGRRSSPEFEIPEVWGGNKR